MLPAMSNAHIRLVQTCYPKIYLACHTRHRRRASSADALSAHDSAMLAHLDQRRATTPSALARHLGIGRSTMSAAAKRLIRLGFIDSGADPGDRRTVLLRLTRKGAAAMAANSVLEGARVGRLLAAMTAADRTAALHGLTLLAEAATRISVRDRPTRKRTDGRA